MGEQDENNESWPLRRLVLRTPRLELRPDDDEGLAELAELALHGVHPPESMPFGYAWTDAPREQLGRNLLQHHWQLRAQLRPGTWNVTFLVRHEGRVVGNQELSAVDFAVRSEVSTGSWLGRSHQGMGIGTEMRAAVLMFAFEYLGAVRARSGAFLDNATSLAISRKLGYVEDGTTTFTPRGEPAIEQRLLLTPERFVARRPEWTIDVDGLEECRVLLGAENAPGAATRQ